MSTSFVTMNDALLDYVVERTVREAPQLAALRRATETLPQGWWQISPLQAQFMAMLAKIAGVRRYLEVGTFTGYGTLSIALSLPEDGEIVTCDVEEDFVGIGRPFWRAAGVADRIEVRIAPALETLPALIGEGRAGSFDMVFLDADKKHYPAYYEHCLELVRPGGIVLIDNILRNGTVIDPDNTERATRAIRTLNDRLKDDRRVDLTMLPFADGIAIARKRP